MFYLNMAIFYMLIAVTMLIIRIVYNVLRVILVKDDKRTLLKFKGDVTDLESFRKSLKSKYNAKILIDYEERRN